MNLEFHSVEFKVGEPAGDDQLMRGTLTIKFEDLGNEVGLDLHVLVPKDRDATFRQIETAAMRYSVEMLRCALEQVEQHDVQALERLEVEREAKEKARLDNEIASIKLPTM